MFTLDFLRTHLLGCIMFIGAALYFLIRPSWEVNWEEKMIFSAFFVGAILCLGFSFTFHTVSCHSEVVGKLFSKWERTLDLRHRFFAQLFLCFLPRRLDYCGIAMLIMGSFVPWLYYGFYCHYQPKIIYLTVVTVLGFFSIVTSLWDKFSTPQLRPVRAGVFMAFGLSGVIPAIHYVYMEGWFNDISRASLGWLVLMGLLYILGAMFYALRIPERWFPGKFDLWVSFKNFQHQFFIANWFLSFPGTITSNFPHSRHHRCARAFPRHQWNGYESCLSRRMRCAPFSNRIVKGPSVFFANCLC